MLFFIIATVLILYAAAGLYDGYLPCTYEAVLAGAILLIAGLFMEGVKS